MVSSLDSDSQPVAPLPEQLAGDPADANNILSFSFASRHGVVVQRRSESASDSNSEPTSLRVIVRRGASPACLSEVKRVLDAELEMELVSTDEFEELLQKTYGQDGSNAKQMVEGLEDDTDLLQVAQDLPEPSDLMEADDDAPIE